MHITHKIWPAFVVILLSLGCEVNAEDQSSAPSSASADSGAIPPVPSDCTDGTQNGLETDVDCGGAECLPCQDGQLCTLAVDCSSGSCVNGICQAITCQDGVQNGTETDLDCGGATCGGCGLGLVCNVNADCASVNCVSGKCAAASCTDGKRNGDETDVDCGGSCSPCTVSCSDGKKNGSETDVDCGGSCPGCPVTSSCLKNTDCGSSLCSVGQCILPKNCKEILQVDPSASSGVFTIDPVQNGMSTPFAAFCDMTNEGGGWTLVLSYNHTGGTNPALVPGTRPLDPNNGFSHYSTAQVAEAVFTELRFFCQTSLHPRVLHFRTSSTGAITYLRGAGTNDPTFWTTGFTTLTGHTANLPAATDAVFNSANIESTEFPFFKVGVSHWAVGGMGNRWECDDFPNDFSGTTLHQVWIR